MRKRIFTWHIHGSYLYYLSQGNYDLYIPVNEQRNEGYYGRGNTFPFGFNVIEIPVRDVRNHIFDVILYQTDHNYQTDQYEILSPEQRKLPRIFLKHDPPFQHPVDAKPVVDDPDVQIVHVTHFNELMWNNEGYRSCVITHGVADTGHSWTGELEKGLVIINNLPARGRLLGLDLFNLIRQKIPLDIVGMGNESLGGYEVLHPKLAEFSAKYRFLFNPIRYTSLGLAVCEAMMTGLPVIGLATTEMAVTIQNGVNGYIHTQPEYLIEKMRLLLDHKEQAEKLSKSARETARTKFNIRRFIREWDQTFSEVMLKNRVVAGNV